MVLVQIPIEGYTSGRITATLPVPYYGRYKVKFLNYTTTWYSNPLCLLKVNSQNLWGDYRGGQLIVSSNPFDVVVFNSIKYEFSTHLTGYIDLDITRTDNTVPANFSNAVFSFDLQREE
jgi:hypothetical protein